MPKSKKVTEPVSITESGFCVSKAETLNLTSGRDEHIILTREPIQNETQVVDFE